MSYKFETSISLQKNIRSVATEELDGCLLALESMDIHEAVHDIRKRLKKLRALARLFRDEMGEKNYKSVNIYFRDLGQELSPIRDLTAHMETIEAIRSRYGNYIYVRFFNSINRKLEKERDKMEAGLRKDKFFDHIRKKIKKARKEMIDWPVNSNDILVILPSIKRVYKRGRKALENSSKNPGKEIFHEWRKRVKYLWYQILLLEDLWPDLFSTWENEIHELANCLGVDHDLMVLNDRLEETGLQLTVQSQKEILHALIKEHSHYLRKQAFLKGKLIYSEKPKHFVKRMQAYTRVNWN